MNFPEKFNFQPNSEPKLRFLRDSMRISIKDHTITNINNPNANRKVEKYIILFQSSLNRSEVEQFVQKLLSSTKV